MFVGLLCWRFAFVACATLFVAIGALFVCLFADCWLVGIVVLVGLRLVVVSYTSCYVAVASCWFDVLYCCLFGFVCTDVGLVVIHLCFALLWHCVWLVPLRLF